MEAWIQALFSNAIIDEALNRFGRSVTDKKKLGDFENYVYEVKQGEEVWILRLTHSSHRTFEEIEAEVDWVNELHRGGVNVSRAHSSSNGKKVERIIVENGSFFACLFEKAPGFGVKPDDPTFGPQLYETWGREVGKMHRISMHDHPRGRRPRWDESDLLRFTHYLTSKEDSSLIKEGEKLVEEIKSFHETGETFGLIHSDVHHGNFFYDGKEIHLFDFDDSMYHYYVSDIAIPVYYAVWRKCGNEAKEIRAQFATEFLFWFLKGYREETNISNEWLRTLPLFLRLRDYELYTVFHKKFNRSTMDEEVRGYLQKIRERLIRSELIADITFDRLIHKVNEA